MTTTENNKVTPSQDTQELSLGNVLEILVRRRTWILAVTGLGLLVGIFLATRPRKFTATGEIRIESGSANMYRTGAASLITGNNVDKIASEVTILQSRTLYLQVAKELNLTNDKDFWGTAHPRQRSLDDALAREEVYRRMRAAISVGRTPKEEIITISSTTTSPALSAKIVNTLINDYVAYLFQMRYGATQRASGWLLGNLNSLKSQIEQDQTQLTSLQGKLGITGSDEKGNTNFLFDQSLGSMAKASGDATIARIVAEAKLRYLQQSDPNLIEGEVNLLGAPTTQPTGLLQSLRDSQAKLASDYSSLLAKTGPNFPEVKQLRAQLNEVNKQVAAEEARIINQAKLSYEAASANEDMTNKVLQQKKSEAYSTRDDMVKYMVLLHDYVAHRTLYEGLVQRLSEAGITSGLEAGEIDIVDLADLPAIPSPPGPLTFILGALLAGLALACVSGLLLETFDQQIKTQDQAMRVTGLNILGVVPHFLSAQARAGQSRSASTLLVDSAPKSRYAESLQAVRTNMLMSRPGIPPKVFLLTSAVPGEGKSTTSANLSATFARHGSRVLLVDCDLRRGTLANRLGLNAKRGLSNILTNQSTLEEAVQPVPGHETLFFLADGPRPPDPAVLMASDQFVKLIEKCRDRFDVIILDSTPGLGLSDALNAGRLADAVVLVVRERHSNRKAVGEAARVLSSTQLPVIGFVLNDVLAESNRYGYGYNSYYEEEPGSPS